MKRPNRKQISDKHKELIEQTKLLREIRDSLKTQRAFIFKDCIAK
jgi:hypothetical protein